jgi:uncharacterized protein YcgI (DUF1989 family)
MDVCCHSNLTRAVKPFGERQRLAASCFRPPCSQTPGASTFHAAIVCGSGAQATHHRNPCNAAGRAAAHLVLHRHAGLQEADVHDVLNVFMCTGFTRGSNQYFTKPSPVRQGDYLEFLGGWCGARSGAAGSSRCCRLAACAQSVCGRRA